MERFTARGVAPAALRPTAAVILTDAKEHAGCNLERPLELGMAQLRLQRLFSGRPSQITDTCRKCVLQTEIALRMAAMSLWHAADLDLLHTEDIACR